MFATKNSRVLVAVFMSLFLVLACLTVGYFGYRQYLEEAALSTLPENERVELKEWLQTPITSDKKVLEPLPSLNPDLVTEKKKFFDAAHQARTSFALKMRRPEAASGLSIQDKLTKGIRLNEQEADVVTSFTATVKPLIAAGRRLVSNPEYTLETRKFPINDTDFLAYNTCFETFYYYACAAALVENWNDAFEALDLLARLLRIDARSGNYGENETHTWVRIFTGSMTDHTSDTEILTRLLNIGLTARPFVENAASESCFDAGTIDQTRHMIADRYINYRPVTRYEHYQLSLTARDYYQWVEDSFSVSAPRKAEKASVMIHDLDTYLPDGPHAVRLRKLTKGVPKFLWRPLYYSANYPYLVDHFKYYKSWQTRTRTDLTQYDLHCLHLVRRISELQESDVTEAELVEKSMGGIPDDPFGNGPLQYDLGKQAYYSVGPDGTAGSEDDIYMASGFGLRPLAAAFR